MTSLYEYSQYYRNLYDLIDSEEVSVEDVQEFLKTVQDGVENKFENISKLIKDFTAKVTFFKEEEERIAKRRRAFESKVKSLKEYLLLSLDVMNVSKVEAGTFRVRKQKNRSSLNVYNEKLIPEKYLIPQSPKIDTEKLSQDVIKNGFAIAGAEVKPTSYHIRIE